MEILFERIYYCLLSDQYRWFWNVGECVPSLSLISARPLACCAFFTSLAIEMDFEATCMNPNDSAWHGATVSAMLTAEP